MSEQTTNSTFRTVMRGYEPSEVDRHLADLSNAAASATARADQLAQELENVHRQADERTPDKPKPPSEPTFHDFGKRVGRILAMAEEEAEEMRTAAVKEVQHKLGECESRTTSARADADQYSQETRTNADQEAARIVEEAKRSADQMIDDAERRAMARRGEAEAIYEEQRARSAKAAADFEKTLAERRDKSEQIFQDRTDEMEHELTEARDLVARTRSDSDQLAAEAKRRSAQITAESEQRAEQIVAEASARADRIRDESDRELAAAIQRRNAINAQLTNVRQMLATLSGTNPAAIPGVDEQA
ncbi:MAG: DivIVA domain-containing protein [Jatrophihabitans sp.]